METKEKKHLAASPWILVAIVVIAAVVIGLMLWGGGSMDNATGRWAMDQRGVWMMEGKPDDIPAPVREQQFLIREAGLAYGVLRSSGTDLSSGPCLGTIFADWVADVVHTPRQSVDDQQENQCQAIQKGEAHHFIELDLDGNVVRIQ